MIIMLDYLTILSIIGLVLAFLIFSFLLIKKDFREIRIYCTMGLIAALIDLVSEYLGTSMGHWTYNESVYFIFDLVPIELLFIFFSGTVIGAFLFQNFNKIKIPIKANTILYILIIVAFLFYIRNIYLESLADMMPLAIVFGLWGIINISEKNRPSALIVAILAVILDFVSEVIIIGSGSYSYKNGFSISIPILYGLIIIGMLAILEKMNKLDGFLDYPIIKKITKAIKK